MEAISFEQLEDFCSRTRIRVADSHLKIGRELTYQEPPLRTVVIHLSESDSTEYISDAISRILSIAEDWLLVPRYGSAFNLNLGSTATHDTAAFLFKTSEQSDLVAYLCSRPMDIGSFSADLYIISATGNTLITWDHHSIEGGINVQLCNLKDSNQILISLNELGAELEVFYARAY